MNAACPKLVIAGTTSGVGKTSITLGLARFFARQGLRVQTFKVGPDFLDPTYLALASGRTCYNLDGWMTSREYVCELFARATADADIALVEGVMGLFDGAAPCGLEGSTAEIAQWLGAPVLLAVNAHGAARSLAAIVQGFARFEPGVRVAGVIANQGGSERHLAWLSESLAGAATAPLVGMMPRGSLPTLPSRHLGLVSAEQAGLSTEILDQLADACGRHLDVSAILELVHYDRIGEHDNGGPVFAIEGKLVPPYSRSLRVGIARDEAFHFYYPDNLEALSRAGIEWVPFSPLADARLPADLDGLYFGGGYPELYAARLADNATLLADIREFAAAGGLVYAECGGLMYLGRALTGLDGVRYPLAGVLPVETAMLEKFQVLGYAGVTWAADSLWGAAGESARGHEFHYSRITAQDAAADWRPAYTVCRRKAEPALEGLCNGRILAGYVHLHWASRPQAIEHFITHCKKQP
jgi:cobyrinic acid a,c-diamide synthase